MCPPLSGCCHGITHRMRLHTRHLVFFSQRAPEEHPGQTQHTHKCSLSRPMWWTLVWISSSELDSNTAKHQRDFGSGSNLFKLFSGIQIIILPCWITFWTWLGSVLHNALQWLRAVPWLACRLRTGPLSTTGRHATLELRFLFSCNAPFKIFRASPVLTHS